MQFGGIFFHSLKDTYELFRGFLGGIVVKYLPANAGDARDMGSIPGSGRSTGERNGNPVQYSCLANHMDRGAWWAIVHGVTDESNMTAAEHSCEIFH